MVLFFIVLLIFNESCSKEIDLYALPNKPSELCSFSRERLRGYIKFYKKEKKEGRVYCNAVVKSEFSLKQHKGDPKHHMLNFWYVHEMVNLERRRRRHMKTFVHSLEAYLRNINLIPEDVLKKIKFPSALPLETQYLMCQSPNIMKYALSEMPQRIEDIPEVDDKCCNIWDILARKIKIKEYI